MSRRAYVVIVNGDDLGYCDERDDGILECFQHGIVRSASLLCTGQSTVRAIDKVRQVQIELGLHFNVTEGPSISAAEDIPSLVDKDGYFKGKSAVWEAARSNQIIGEHIEREAKAQIRWFKEHTGHSPIFIDGHNHIHVVPSIATVLAKVCKEEGIQWIRLPIEPLGDWCDWFGGPRREFLSQVTAHASEVAEIFASHGLRTTNAFVGLSLMGSDATLERIESAFAQAVVRCNQSTAAGTTCLIEWMTHPGYAQTISKGGDDFSRSSDRDYERKLLQSEELRALFVKLDISIGEGRVASPFPA